MGSIISSKVRDDGKVVFEVCVDSKEALQLKGHVENVYLIPTDAAEESTNVVQRGKNEATMYLLLPKSARAGIGSVNRASFQVVNAPGKTLLIYSVKND